MTAGVLSVNPNTMYPLLRGLEARGLIEGSWEHPERRTRRYYSLTGRGHGGVRAAGRGGAAVPRLGQRVRSTRSCARCTASEDRAGPTAAVPLAPDRGARPLDRHRAAGRASWRASGTSVERDREWPASRSAKVVWESMPGGRGRVTEQVVERDAGPARDARSSRTRWPARRPSSARPAAATAARGASCALEYELSRVAARCGAWPTRSSSAARCATRCAGRSAASRSRRRRKPGSGSLAGRRPAVDPGGIHVRVQSRRRRRGHDGRRDRPGDRGRRPPGRAQGRRSRSSSTTASRRPGRSPRASSGPRGQGEDHPGAGRRASSRRSSAASPARPTTTASATSTS